MVEVFYEDNHLIAVYKKSSDLSQRDRTGDSALIQRSKNTWLKNITNPEMFSLGSFTGLTVR